MTTLGWLGVLVGGALLGYAIIAIASCKLIPENIITVIRITRSNTIRAVSMTSEI